MADFWGISDGSVCAPHGAAAGRHQVQSRFSGAIGADQGGQAAGLKLEADLINGQLVFVKAQLFSAKRGGRDGCGKLDAGIFFSGFSC